MKRLAVALIAVLFVAVLAYADNTTGGTASTGSQVSSGGSTVGGTQGTTGTAPAGTTTPPKKGKVGKRQARQMKRIKQGVKSGALTKGETKKLVDDQKMIQEQKKDMKEDNGGTLSTEDKETLNKEQNQESKKIYDLKHNDATR
jgi:hypothetical protein